MSRVKMIGMAMLCAALCACAGMTARPERATTPEAVVVRVNGEPIRQADVTGRIAELRQSMPNVPPYRLTRMALDQLIDNKLVDQRVAAEGIKVGEDAVDARLGTMARDLAQEGLTVSGYCASLGVTTATLRGMIRKQMTIEAFWDKRLGLKPPTDEALRQFYQKNPKAFTAPEAVHLYMIFLPLPEGRRPTRSEREAMQVTAEAMRARLAAGEDFATVARAAARGRQGVINGDMGWVDAQAPLPPGVIKAIFKLEPGKISEVLPTNEGFFITMVKERRGPQLIAFEAVRERLALDLMREERMKRIPGEMNKLRREAKIEYL